ncbi:GPW/gp25 family protein [Massilia sp. P8910]|uniref:GPW/gp25 family protein n=1 Tax=Massilia antarctica TaxID=2765360 RepID=A0AA48WCA2_9BURK|nr:MULTISPECIES: GPW/gp25 family protein [Massilia]CUI03272.1 GPW/gp25 family protein [Janthinobacterium sp. CG23_2]MCE3604301.1 GPW/gp25 family protein [Massilia antarctica]MCY0914356.1 GPW/gp25 family protein [Massilia sp. H27-R4]QPI48914.1 GPW/gp25 family protein [Massilia antarctica]CUU27058.1 GPW/gp25 family protein [Janthinobacterium sp. CG23_2]
MSIDQSFLGRGWSFPPAFAKSAGPYSAGGQAAMVSGDDDIVQSLHILLSTAPGERVMRPTFGCGIKLHVFDSISYNTLTEIKGMIAHAILFFEPRVTLEQITVSDAAIEQGRLDIHLVYTVRLTNTRSNMVYPFYFVEGTNATL